MVNDSMKLGGYLVGYGISHNNKKKFEKWLDKPKHNTITKYMLNGLLQYNGDNTCYSLINNGNYVNAAFIRCSSSNITRTGVINYGAYGTGTGTTKVSDTDLKNRVSDFSTNRVCYKDVSNTYYNGTYCDTTTRTHKYRIATNFGQVSQSVTVTEVGLFHRIEPDGSYYMTARVELDEPITLEEGDSFYFIYEIHIKFSDESFIKIPSINMYARKINNIYSTDKNYWSLNNNSSGYNRISYSNNNIYGYGSDSSYGGKRPVYAIPSSIAIYTSSQQFNGNFNASSSSVTSYNYNTFSYTIEDYVVDSFQRDYNIELYPHFAPNKDIYALVVNGEAYQFGDYNEQTGVFTPRPWHKNDNVSVKMKFRQSWSTDLLTPAGDA